MLVSFCVSIINNQGSAVVTARHCSTMPEKTFFPHLLGTDIDHIVPSLDMELDENSLIRMMDHDLTMVY